jgi:hypothetical protein
MSFYQDQATTEAIFMQYRLNLKSPAVVLLIICILITCPVSAQVTFLSDWADFGSQFQREGRHTSFLDGQRVGWEAGHTANHWLIVQEKGEDRLQAQDDRTSPKGGAVLRVEVRPGDYLGYAGERAEVSHMIGPTGELHDGVTGTSGHEVYAISIKLDPNWQPPLHDKTHGGWQWGDFMQLHSPDESGGPPAFALCADDTFHAQTLAGDLIGENGQRRNATSLPFSNGELRSGHWIQFLIDVVWAYDSQGSLTVYRRDEGESAFTPVLTLTGQPTLQFNSQFPDSKNSGSPLPSGPKYLHYWKAGYYRSVSPGVTSRLWLGPIARGASLQEVAVAAFGRP